MYCQARFDPLPLRSAPLTCNFKKLRAYKRKLWGCRTVGDQIGGSRGVLIKHIAEGLMKIISRRWSYSQLGRQITVKNRHVNGSKVSSLNINSSRRVGERRGGGGGGGEGGRRGGLGCEKDEISYASFRTDYV